MHSVYTMGYTGLSMEAIQKKVQELDAYLVDIRYMAGSRAPMWRQASFKSALKERYIHLQALGNKNYRGGPIEIADLSKGIAFVEKILPHNNVLLMCACEDVNVCHRKWVSRKLFEAGADIIHLRKTDFAEKPKKKKESVQPLKLL